jgi:transposase InsO family protein
VGEDGREHPIAYYSKKLLESEQKWDIWEREMSACVWAADKCRAYLLGNEFDLVTDSKVVHSLLDKSTWPSKRANWVMRLSEFDFKVKHRKGELNPVADFLSRWATNCMDTYEAYESARATSQINALHRALNDTEHLIGRRPGRTTRPPTAADDAPEDDDGLADLDPTVGDSDEEMPDAQAALNPSVSEGSGPERPDIPFPQWMAEQQRADVYINELIAKEEAALAGNQLPDEGSRKPKGGAREYRLINNERLLTTKVKVRGARDSFTEYWAILVPRTAVTAVLELYHGSGSVHNHNGRNKTINQIRMRFTWPSMYSDVDRWIKACGKCMERKRVVLPQARYTLSTNMKGAFERLAIDFVGPLTTTKRKNSYLLTMIDPFTRWAEAFPVTRNTALKTIACLKSHIAAHGTPAELLTDRGFLSEELRTYLKAMGIKHNCTAAYTPSTNGSVEGFHSYLATGLSALVNEQHSNWDEHIDAVLLAYRTAVIDGTGISPFEIVYGRPANLPLDNALAESRVWEDEPEDPETTEEYAAKVHQHAAEVSEASIQNAALVRAAQEDRHRRNKRQDEGVRARLTFQKGQQVYLKFPPGTFRVGGGTTKFSKVNSGPYTVDEVLTTSSGATIYAVRHNLTQHFCKVSSGRMIPYEKWEEPKGTTRPLYLPGQVPAKAPKEAASRAEPKRSELPDKALAGEPAKGGADITQGDASDEVGVGAERIAGDNGEPMAGADQEPPKADKGRAVRNKRRLEAVLAPEPEAKAAKKPRVTAKATAVKEPDPSRPAYKTTAEGRRRRERMAVDLLRLWEPLAHPGSRQ